MTSSSKLITSSVRDEVLFLTFHDPSSRNAFSLCAARELRESLRRHQGQYASMVFSARGRVFCSGGNLSDYASMERAQQGIDVNREIADVLAELDRCPCPTVCAVDGDCFGGGVELLSAFDVIVASPQVLFGLWQRRIGLTFGWGGGARLERKLGAGVLRRWALTTESISTSEALESGLIDAVVPSTQLEFWVEQRARSLSRLPKAPVPELKSWSTDREREIFEGLWWNDEHRAILRKRPKR